MLKNNYKTPLIITINGQRKMITYFIAMGTMILYARWISKTNPYTPTWFRLFLGIVWGIIVAYSVMC